MPDAKLSDLDTGFPPDTGDLVYISRTLGDTGQSVAVPFKRFNQALKAADISDTGSRFGSGDTGYFLTDSGQYVANGFMSILGRTLVSDTGQTKMRSTLGIGSAYSHDTGYFLSDTGLYFRSADTGRFITDTGIGVTDTGRFLAAGDTGLFLSDSGLFHQDTGKLLSDSGPVALTYADTGTAETLTDKTLVRPIYNLADAADTGKYVTVGGGDTGPRLTDTGLDTGGILWGVGNAIPAYLPVGAHGTALTVQSDTGTTPNLKWAAVGGSTDTGKLLSDSGGNAATAGDVAYWTGAGGSLAEGPALPAAGSAGVLVDTGTAQSLSDKTLVNPVYTTAGGRDITALLDTGDLVDTGKYVSDTGLWATLGNAAFSDTGKFISDTGLWLTVGSAGFQDTGYFNTAMRLGDTGTLDTGTTLWAAGNGTFNQLPVGSDGQVLTVSTDTGTTVNLRWETPSGGGDTGKTLSDSGGNAATAGDIAYWSGAGGSLLEGPALPAAGTAGVLADTGTAQSLADKTLVNPIYITAGGRDITALLDTGDLVDTGKFIADTGSWLILGTASTQDTGYFNTAMRLGDTGTLDTGTLIWAAGNGTFHQLPVGSDGQVLTVSTDTGTTPNLRWEAVPGGGDTGKLLSDSGGNTATAGDVAYWTGAGGSLAEGPALPAAGTAGVLVDTGTAQNISNKTFLDTGVQLAAMLGGGVGADTGTFLRGDGSWASVPGAGDTGKTLSDSGGNLVGAGVLATWIGTGGGLQGDSGLQYTSNILRLQGGAQIEVEEGVAILDTGGNEILKFGRAANAANFLEVRNAASGGSPYIRALGDDTDVPFGFQTQNSGAFNLWGGNFELILYARTVGDTGANYYILDNAAAGNGPVLTAWGSDASVDFNLNTKGTGVGKVNNRQVLDTGLTIGGYAGRLVDTGTTMDVYAKTLYSGAIGDTGVQLAAWFAAGVGADTGTFLRGDGSWASVPGGGDTGKTLSDSGGNAATAGDIAYWSGAGGSLLEGPALPAAGTAGVLADTGTAQTFASKTIDLTVNTVTGSLAEFNTALDAGGFADTGTVRISEIAYVIDGGGSAITTGQKGYLPCDISGTITQMTICVDTGDIDVDIWKDVFANYPPTDADSITASAVPAVDTGLSRQDSTLTGWTTSVAAGDVFGFNVDSVAKSPTFCAISLKVQRT